MIQPALHNDVVTFLIVCFQYFLPLFRTRGSLVFTSNVSVRKVNTERLTCFCDIPFEVFMIAEQSTV